MNRGIENLDEIPEVCECGNEKYTTCDSCGCNLCTECMRDHEYLDGVWCDECFEESINEIIQASEDYKNDIAYGYKMTRGV